MTSAPASVSWSWMTSTSSGPMPGLLVGGLRGVHRRRVRPARPRPTTRAPRRRRSGGSAASWPAGRSGVDVYCVAEVGPAQHDRGRALVGRAEHVLGQRVVEHPRREDLLLGDRLAAEGVRVERAVAVVLGRHLGQGLVGDAVVVHVAVDLHGEELRGEEVPDLAVPGRRAVVDGVGGERARLVLVHADGDADVVLARADGVGRQLQRRRRGGAAVVDVHERDAGEPEPADDRVGVVDLEAAAERELHVLPLRRRRRRSAARIASAPMSMADLGPKRPNGCSPTPMMATSSIVQLLVLRPAANA